MLSCGETLGAYRITGVIDIGGQGSVYQAQCPSTAMAVAIKCLDADPSAPAYGKQTARFRREALLRLGHPNIVDPIEHFEQDGKQYIVYPLIEGQDFAALIQSRGPLSEVEFRRFAGDLASALAHLHRIGIVHRDIKPANILMGTDGRARLIDFGICKNSREATISTGEIVGTPCWMSPEQTHSSDVGAASDLFSLGLLFFFVLTGVAPIQAPNMAQAKKITCECDVPAPSQIVHGVPPELDAICRRLTSRRAEDRVSAEELCLALDDLSGSGQFCTSCGHRIDSTARFCGHCGAQQHPTLSMPLCLACRASVGEAKACIQCGRLFSPHDHRLIFHSGPAAGLVFRLPQGSYFVGREQIEPRDCALSRQRHIQVRCENGTVTIADAGSTNKTYVQGRLADVPLPLSPRQELVVAKNRATYTSN